MTRHGKPAGVLLPLSDPQAGPLEIRRKLYLDLSAKIARQLDAKGITEEKLQRGFEEFKKRRRRQHNIIGPSEGRPRYVTMNTGAHLSILNCLPSHPITTTAS